MPLAVPARIAVRYLDRLAGNQTQPLSLQPDYGTSQAALPRGDEDDIAARVADRYLEARDPPFYEAAKADEHMGGAYRSLVDLKLGFDSWHEIPKSAQPLYNLIGKAMGKIGEARKDTYRIRMMVQRKRYGAGNMLSHPSFRKLQNYVEKSYGELLRSGRPGDFAEDIVEAYAAARHTSDARAAGRFVAKVIDHKWPELRQWFVPNNTLHTLAYEVANAFNLGVPRRAGGRLKSPASSRDDIPLTNKQDGDAWNAGYEAASYHWSKGRPLRESDEAFLWTVRNDRRVPDVKEGDPSFWEWVHAVGEGAAEFNKTVNERFRMASDRTAFNKESPDELMGQLVKILKREGLRDVASRVKGLQPAIQKAWRERDQE